MTELEKAMIVIGIQAMRIRDLELSVEATNKSRLELIDDYNRHDASWGDDRAELMMLKKAVAEIAKKRRDGCFPTNAELDNLIKAAGE